MTIGSWLFGSWGIILGAAVAVFTLGKTTRGMSGTGGMNGLWGDHGDLSQRRQIFSRIVFLTSGHIAQADGRVTEQEVQCAGEVMKGLGMNRGQRTHAMHQFTVGTQPGYDLESNLRELMRVCGSDSSMISTFIEIQVAMACADGQISPSEREIIHTSCVMLDFPENQVQAFIERYLRHTRQSGPAPADEENSNWAYDLLDVQPTASMQEVQRAYGRKMKEFHPDKLASKGLPKEFMDFATERTKQFTKAYQTIKKAAR